MRIKDMIEISKTLSLHENELSFEFIRASGPGGQNVNKVATAVRLRFDLKNSQSLTDQVKNRLNALVGNRINRDGILTITSQRYRQQEKNRLDAIEKLKSFLIAAETEPKPHKKTVTPKNSKLQRLQLKKRRSQVKDLRRLPSDQEF